MNPTNPANAPDPATSYERAKPEKEAGMGRLTNNSGTPERRPDKIDAAVPNRQVPEHQINAEDEQDDSVKVDLNRPKEDAQHSMLEEEPDGWDLAPADIHNPRHKRHPRKEGKGGTP